MKKLLTLCLLIATTFAANAQTEEETTKWLTELPPLPKRI
jgi:hypothetical protein